MPTEPIKIPVVILAAGLSGRMGVSKPFLKWDHETSFIEKIIGEYRNMGSEKIAVVVSTQVKERIDEELPHLCDEVQFIINPEPEKGKFLSLRMGLKELGNPDYCFIQNIDNPFIDCTLLSGMGRLIEPDACVVPLYCGKTGHPMLAGKLFLDYIQTLDLKDHDLRLLMKPFRMIFCETENSRVLININSREDYQSAVGNLE